jgi:hypothetical protein
LLPFHHKVSLESPTGGHIRYLPATCAAALVSAGRAAVSASNGRARAIRLTETAAVFAERVGPPTGVTQ